VKRELPEDAARFATTDKDVRGLVQEFMAISCVLQSCTTDGVLVSPVHSYHRVFFLSVGVL
jgi:hypothetical protein